MNDPYEIFRKTQEYNEYVQTHRANVLRAWKEMQQKCKSEPIIYDDWKFWNLDAMVKAHDLSKYSPEEFVQYRRNFYPCQDEGEISEGADISGEFEAAWKHHYENNSHHWEHWAGRDDGGLFRTLSYAEMVLDWTAMGYVFGGTALDYYTKNKDKIVFPETDSREYVERLLKQMAQQ